jgi:hypothetical protein
MSSPACGRAAVAGHETCPEGNETECDDCGTCEISGIELEPGEEYKFVEGVCDIDDIECMECTEEGTQIRDRSYTMDMFVDKLEGDVLNFRIEITDPFATIIDSKQYSPFEEADIMSARYRYNFTCPTKILVDNVDKQSCFQFLDEYVGENDPMSYILAQQTTDYKEDLLTCQSELMAANSLMSNYKDTYTDCETFRKVAEDKVYEINRTMKTQERDITERVTAETRGEVATWTLTATMGWICFLLLLGSRLLGGGW